jgi:alkylhydroperoxidase/carboxymuconolactone decarboxylase family protein YurZ
MQMGVPTIRRSRQGGGGGLAGPQPYPGFPAGWPGPLRDAPAPDGLDGRTQVLARLAVTAALRLTGLLPALIAEAKAAGAAREEVLGAVLLGLRTAGVTAPEMLPAVASAFDGPYRRGAD